MDMMNAILHRRSVRQYTAEAIPEEKLNAILHAGLAAPSSKNRRPWELIVIRDRDMLARLCACRPGAEKLLATCNAAIVVGADSRLVDVWVEDAAAAMTQMHLMADALGIGSCWLQVRLRKAPDGERSTEDVVRELLHIPEHISVMAILTLGMPVAHPGARSADDLPLDKIHYERF